MASIAKLKSSIWLKKQVPTSPDGGRCGRTYPEARGRRYCHRGRSGKPRGITRAKKHWLGQLSAWGASASAEETTLSQQHKIVFGIAEQLLLVALVIPPDQEEEDH